MAYRMSKEELDEQFEQFLKESLSDDSFDGSKRSSVLENLGKPRNHKNNKNNKKDSSSWWTPEDDSDDGDLLSPSRSFIKSKRASLPIKEEEEENEHIEETLQSNQDHVSASIDRDSLDVDDSVVASGPNQTVLGVGLDTLEEQEEKERFFARLENGASSTVDYSKLNKGLDSTDSSKLTALICYNEEPKSIQDDDDDDSDKKGKTRDSSGSYSEDFEDDGDSSHHKNKEEKDHAIVDNLNLKKEEEKPGMLAKVMLLDSLDSTMDAQKYLQETGTRTSQGTREAMGTGVSNVYTNSDVEALQIAYKHIQSMEDTDEQKSYKTMDHTNTAFEDIPDSIEKSLKKLSTAESDVPTVDELMQHIRRETLSDIDYDVNPSSQMRTDYIYQYTAKKLQDTEKLHNVSEWNAEKMEEKSEFFTSDTEIQFINSRDPLTLKSSVGDERLGHQVDSLLPDERNSHDLFNLDQNLNTFGIVHGHKLTKDKSPTSLPKKPHNLYAHVRSSGYGKSSTRLKTPTLAVKFNSEEYPVKPKDTSPDRKGALPTTRTIRLTGTETVPKQSQKDYSLQHNQKSVPQMDFDKSETVFQHDKNDSFRSTSGFHVENNASQSLNMSDAELNMFLKLQNIEEKLNSDQTHSKILREEFSKKEEECLQKIEDLKTKHDAELHQLKQENYILLTKLHTMEDKGIKKLHLGDPKNPMTDEKVQQIRKEIEEQEKLLQGYQQENERLYQQVKELQAKNKQNEELMFQENQSLKANLLSLREQLSKATITHQRPPDISEKFNSESFTDLLVELRTVKKQEAGLLDEISRQKQDKQALEVDLLQMRKERDNLKTLLTHASGDKSYEMKIMEETYKQEINVLNKKLKWFAENQELLDKDAGRLRNAYEQIETLKMQVEKLQNETGNQCVQQQKRPKERAADAKRIQDLERQVKEMEGIIKRRHPNSIPALIFAAAAAPGGDDKDSAKTNTIAFLERRVKKLETDLESKDDDAKKSLRTMEQQFQKVKIQYESRIHELEELLTHKLINDPQQSDNSTKSQKFKEELLICKETHQATIQNLQRQIDLLRENNLVLENNERKKAANLSGIGTKVEEASNKDLIVKLSQELVAKRTEIQDLTKTVERLQKERMIMLSVKNPSINAGDKKSSDQARTDISAPGKRSIADSMSFPETLDEKLYHPGTFADIHISDVQEENAALKYEVERLSLKINEQKETFQALLYQGECTIKRLKEESSEQAAALKLLHQKEVEKRICQHAIEHSSSKVAELSSKISTQEILIKHLQTQVKELQKDRESLAIYRIREETLQQEVAKLFEELKEAKECHSPEMKHFIALENKIKYMEVRHLQREQELQQIIQQTRHVASNEQTEETDKWKKLAQQKNTELEKFRTELDAILDVLRMLQRQGVVIPEVTSQRTVT
ncbi:centrosomal protein of 162 kDa isoform X2 [Xenopus laevis]|uniref:Centrosomal protein of 162 kDa n=2 Tax=Xenopus laevis TaxID=8355 RepID=A0A1L8G9Q5_XENLA|nr:centrosomal protein of 162 kDa isoform X2 [Xenopus laevis]XP_018118884.1 centrosomal protein of 162 kDa isoform X2 [Xenopus laevis]OCT80471.1 hypothetical protein XELAEV_18027283mg [Xenopus laevis]